MKTRAFQLDAAGRHVALVTVLAVACLLTAASGIASSAWAAEPDKKAVRPATVKPIKKIAPKVSASRAELRSKATQMAAGVRAAEAALSPEELAIAERIHTGQVACELGVTVTIKADARSPGYFDLESKKFKFRMFPVVTSTGAIRLQDARADAVWLQLANKSMLMSQKQGSRLADVCMNAAQTEVAAEMEKHPPESLLAPVKAATQAAAEHLPLPVPALAGTVPAGHGKLEKAPVQLPPVTQEVAAPPLSATH